MSFKNNGKPRFRVYKIDIDKGKDRCGVAKHFLTKNTNIIMTRKIELHLIEQLEECNYDVEGKLWCRGKYWQAQLSLGRMV